MPKQLGNSYKVQPRLVGKRTADYEAMKAAIAPWQFTDTTDWSGNGNVAMNVDFSGDHPVVLDEWNSSAVLLWRAISSALLMYRLAVAFEGTISTTGQTGYKCVWQMALKHRRSGVIIAFGEHKGGAQFWTPYVRVGEMRPALKRDLLLLLDFLTSKNCAHPYDGLVAGSVA